MGIRTLAAFLFLCSPLFAAEAVIEGPEEAAVGQIFTLDSAESSGDFQEWIVDERLTGMIECGSSLSTNSMKAGLYKFILVVSDANGIDYTIHEVKVGTPPPPEPEPPVEPEPPSGSYTEVKKASDQGLAALSDKATATRLITALNTVSSIPVAIENTLQTRTGESLNKDWLTLWRKPVEAQIDLLPEVDQGLLKKTLLDSLTQYTSSQPTSSTYAVPVSKPVLYVYTRKSGCAPCTQWRMNEEIATGRRFTIRKVYSHTHATPSFQLEGDSEVLVGYRTSKQLISKYLQ